MSLLDAVIRTGEVPPEDASQADKKRFSERLSENLAQEMAEALRVMGFRNTHPVRGGPGEREFQGGLGPKKVDVSFSDEKHGLLLAVSIKTINSAPFGKNLKNRFADLCTEAITLHLRFPYSVICALFAFPIAADEDITQGRTLSTFRRATRLLATVSGRAEYTDPGEKFEHVAMMLYQPVEDGGPEPWVRLYDANTEEALDEPAYLERLRQIFNKRNPHLLIGDIDD